MKKFKGLSFNSYMVNKSIVTYDVDLVKNDLTNHLFTKIGERVKMPNFGTRIPDMLFEPLDETTLDIIKNDFTYVMKYDPRVEINDIKIIPVYDQNAVYCVADLKFIDFNLNDVLYIKLEFEG